MFLEEFLQRSNLSKDEKKDFILFVDHENKEVSKILDEDESFWVKRLTEWNESLQPIFEAKIDIKKLTKDAKLPAFSRKGDACMDCYANKDVTIPGFTLENGLGRALVPLGFAMALPRGWEALVRPRSGLALKDGLTILNTPGTIDENYRGEVGAIVVNTTAKDYEVKKGDRICQLAIRPILGAELDLGNPKVGASFGVIWNEVDELDETNRGKGGFGSSGKN